MIESVGEYLAFVLVIIGFIGVLSFSVALVLGPKSISDDAMERMLGDARAPDWWR